MELLDEYEKRCNPKDYLLFGDCIEDFYKARRVYLKNRTLNNRVIAENEMYCVFFQAKGYMSMDSISQEEFKFIKAHLENAFDDDKIIE